MKKYIFIGIGLIIIGIGYVAFRIRRNHFIEEHRELSYKEAGTDFKKVFNGERAKRGLPIIPLKWRPINPLYYKIQVWENPDTIPPRYAEKTVAAGTKAQIQFEVDRYELRKEEGISYQVVIEYDYRDSTFICTLRNTQAPDAEGLRWEGDILDTLTFTEAIDTLRAYGLNRN